MGPYCEVCSNYFDQCVCPLPPLVIVKQVPPDPDCFICRGSGLEFGDRFPCDCTKVCSCGEERPSNLESCRHPGCDSTGCTACDDVEWCCNPDDEDNGDWFCSEHRA